MTNFYDWVLNHTMMKKLLAIFIFLASFSLFSCEDPGEEILEKQFNQKSHTIDSNEKSGRTAEVDDEESGTAEVDEEHS